MQRDAVSLVISRLTVEGYDLEFLHYQVEAIYLITQLYVVVATGP